MTCRLGNCTGRMVNLSDGERPSDSYMPRFPYASPMERGAVISNSRRLAVSFFVAVIIRLLSGSQKSWGLFRNCSRAGHPSYGCGINMLL